MTVDRELVATRIAKIRVELRHLERLQRLVRDEFLASTTEQHAVERELQIVIEAGLIEAALGRRLEEMASFRNRLVHGYLDLEPGRVYDVARDELGAVEAFVAALVARYIRVGER